MLYNAINAMAILIGGSIGLLLKKGLPEKLTSTLLKVIGLSVLYIGITSIEPEADALFVILSLVLGTIIGELIDIDALFYRFAHALGRRLPGQREDGDFAKGFVAATVLFCAGSMGITGALQAGAKGQGDILLAKSLLDGITSIMYASSMGSGVLLSSPVLFIYQGIFVIFAQALQPLLSASVMGLISTVGGIIIMGIGLNLALESEIPIANMVPAVFLPMLFGLLNLV